MIFRNIKILQRKRGWLNEKCKEYKDIAVISEPTELPNISVIIPCYNAAQYLEKCLDSLIRQSYKNIEVICIDDGSIDRSIEILNKYKNEDDRIIIFRKENGGLSSARNAGMEIATGEYIYFLDSDDYLDLKALMLYITCPSSHQLRNNCKL